ncbi:uncharacterized protein TNIN_371851 [Trichonephila inaurata madagascariensis]|uniref:Uncharacterized protein n=1 Tax=Trichonephila inaurata madagascariensis TaxID=2747483 RepID=A0A8X6MCI1_9ARAC|nr:uncharacterized protein TNIN_371851 [Trichonephila inaurata madagascariensis]
MTVTFNISEVMEFTYGAEVDASNCRTYDSLNCKGCCSGGRESSERVKKHVRFADEVNRCEGTQQLSSQYVKRDVGLCSCCKDASIENESHGVGRPILIYGIESPKFDSKSVHQTDFGPKTVPFKEMPPWHPILKDRWKMPDVPSFKKSTYQTDYTPPIGVLRDRKPVYLAPKKKVDRCQELSENFKAWRKTSVEPNQTHNICEKPLMVQEAIQPTAVGVQLHTHGLSGDGKNQIHGPECEKHCSSAPLKCHIGSPTSENTKTMIINPHGDGYDLHNPAAHNTTVCVTKDNLRDPATNNYDSINETKIYKTMEAHQPSGRHDCIDSNSLLSGHSQNNHLSSHHGIKHVHLEMHDGHAVNPPEIHRHEESCSPNHSSNLPIMEQNEASNLVYPYGDRNIHYVAQREHHDQLAAGDGHEHSDRHVRFMAETRHHDPLAAGDGHDHGEKHVRFMTETHHHDPLAVGDGHDHGEKHVHFKTETYPHDPSTTSNVQNADWHHHHDLKTPCGNVTRLGQRISSQPNAFTICDSKNNQEKYWWRVGDAQNENVKVKDVPQCIIKPFCPPYLTMYQRDFQEPPYVKEPPVKPHPECGCALKRS